jgi:hypothetical protein
MKMWQIFLALPLCLALTIAHAQMFAAGRPAPIAGQYGWYDGGSPLFRISTQRTHINVVSIPGTVTSITADDCIIKTDGGKTYTATSTWQLKS